MLSFPLRVTRTLSWAPIRSSASLLRRAPIRPSISIGRLPTAGVSTHANPLDPDELKALSLRVVDDLAGASGTQLIYIGDQLGLFKALAQQPGLTADELSHATGCHPRYVETWADACVAHSYMERTAAGVDKPAYRMSAAQSLVFAEEGGRFFQCGTAQFLTVSGRELPAIMERGFRQGGGVAWSEFGDELGEATARITRHICRDVLPKWVSAVPEAAAALASRADGRVVRILDVGCGHGESTLSLARAFPHADVLGIDPDGASITAATDRLREASAPANARFEKTGVEQVEKSLEGDGVDLVLCYDCVHDMPDPAACLSAIHRMLGGARSDGAPPGAFLWFEPHGSDDPYENREILGARMVAGIALNCVTTSMAQGGSGLGAHGCTPNKAQALATQAGFSLFLHERSLKGAQYRNNVYVVAH
jgi:SAM-dependent methyltransferase